MSAAVSRRGLLLAVPRAFRAAGDDAELLAAAVGLEQVAAATYAALRATDVLVPAARRALRRIEVQERDHAALLASALDALGSDVRAPAPPPDAAQLTAARRRAGLREPLVAGGEEAAVAVAVELENALIAGYHAAIGKLDDGRLVTVATQVMAAEAQHATVMRGLLTDAPALLVPGAFETGRVTIR